MIPNELPDDLRKKILRDAKLRRELGRQSHWYFFNIYLAEHLKHKTAPFQFEMFALTESEIELAVIAAFRNSGKSTIITQSYPIWAIVGRQQRKLVLIISKTQAQARQHFMNIRRELDGNRLLKNELGPFKDTDDQWGSMILSIPRHRAQIVAASREQGIRGLKHGAYRPDLIICDDVEDLESVRTAESRQKTYDWFNGEVMPAGDKGTKIFVLGNVLHEDSLIKRLEADIAGGREGIVRIWPIIGDDGSITWPGKFRDMKAIEALRRKVDERTWQREYLQNIIPDEAQVIDSNWIQYGDPPNDRAGYKRTIIGIDPAISQKKWADKTGMVAVHVFGSGTKQKIYVEPAPVNRKLSLYQSAAMAKQLGERLREDRWKPEIFSEGGGFQSALREVMLNESLIPVTEVTPGGKGKGERLVLVSPLVESRKVYFPKRGAEGLIRQLVGYPSERYDDLLDAFVICLEQAKKTPGYGIKIVRGGNPIHRIDLGPDIGTGRRKKRKRRRGRNLGDDIDDFLRNDPLGW